MFKKDEIIVLLGAGASFEAEIPTSQGMIQKIEGLLDQEWAEYRDLYHFLKTSIRYLDSIRGRMESTSFNIEQLVNTLDELGRGDEHPLYPFVGAWIPKLSEVAGPGLRKVQEFRSDIVRRLRDDWVQLRYTEDASYYAGLSAFQKSFQHPLRVFTLNYDLCVETNCLASSIERGFNDKRQWDWRLFDEQAQTEKNLFLYKLHGSIDWTYDSGNLIYLDAISQINPDDIAIIFGTTYKLQYVDPFLFFAYEFRRWTLDFARIIVAVGYGFADPHINGILGQSLKRDPSRKLLTVAPVTASDETQRAAAEADRCREIAKALDLRDSDQIICWNCKAKEFFQNRLTLASLSKLFPTDETLFPELPVVESADAPHPVLGASETASAVAEITVESNIPSEQPGGNHQAAAAVSDMAGNAPDLPEREQLGTGNQLPDASEQKQEGLPEAPHEHGQQDASQAGA